MTFEEWWEEYHKISIYGKGYKALAQDGFKAGYEQGYSEGWVNCENESDDYWEATD